MWFTTTLGRGISILAVRRLVRGRSRWNLFYNDNRAPTPWGDTRPDYGRNEVRQYIFDNVFIWLNEYHVDGLRFAASPTLIPSRGPGGQDLPEGWSLLQWINGKVAQQFPGKITIAEDMQTTTGSPKTPARAARDSARSGTPTSSTPSVRR